MFLFAWLVVIALLVLVAEFLLMGRRSVISMATEHRFSRSQASHRAVAILTVLLLTALIAWGLFGRQLFEVSG